MEALITYVRYKWREEIKNLVYVVVTGQIIGLYYVINFTSRCNAGQVLQTPLHVIIQLTNEIITVSRQSIQILIQETKLYGKLYSKVQKNRKREKMITL